MSDRVSLLEQEKAFLSGIQKLNSLFPDLGRDLEIPSVILLASQSSGKSSLVDCLANINGFSDTGEGTKTRLPIKLCMSSNDDIGPDPQISYVLPSGGFQNMSLQQCQDFTNNVNANIARKPIPFFGVDKMLTFNISSSECHNLSIIDLPGLRTGDFITEVNNIARDLLTKIRDSFILVLEGPEADWDNPSEATKLVMSDPALKKRSILVRTKLALKLAQLKDESEYLKMFSGGKSSAFKDWLSPPFFVDCGLPNLRKDESYDVHDFLETIDLENIHTISRNLVKDKALLDDIIPRVGVSKLRECLQKHLTQKLVGGVSGIALALDRKRIELEAAIKGKDKQLKEISIDALGDQLSTLFAAWWNIWKDLLAGTANDYILEEYGMTIEDERKDFGPYRNAANTPLSPALDGILAANHKLLGGPQIKRTIDEFYEIAKVIYAESKSENAVLNALRPGDIHNGIDIITSCSKIVCLKSREQLNPLIEQLVGHCGKVMERLPEICARLVVEENKAKKMQLNHFEKYFEWLSNVCKDFNMQTINMCEDYTRFDFWAATEYIEIDDDYVLKEKIDEIMSEVDKEKPPTGDTKETEAWAIKSAASIVPLLFKILVTNFFKNAKRKLHVFFLLGFGEHAPDASRTLLAKINKEFKRLDVKNMFNVDTIKKDLELDIKKTGETLHTIYELQTLFKSL